MPAEQRVCVLDAGPIIHLDQVDALDLLCQLGQLVVPETVAREAEKHRLGIAARLANWIVPDPQTISRELLDVIQNYRLDAGESAALAWAQQFGAELFVSDDKRAREAAGFLNYPSIGTLGVIEAAFNLGILKKKEAVDLLESLPRGTTLFVRPALLAAVLARLH